MRKRILTAVIGIPFTIFCLVVRGWFAELVIAVLAETAMIECYRALRACKYNVFPWGGYIAVLGLFRDYPLAEPIPSESSPAANG